jgi:TRAP-type transport system small permease protein
MKSILAVLDSVSDGLNSVVEVLTILFTGTLIVLFLLGVSSRYFFDMPLMWLFETTMIIFIWSASFGFCLAFKRREHIAVTFLLDHLSGNAKKVLLVLIESLVMVFLVIVVVQGVEIVQETSTQYYHTIPVSTGWLYAALPVCSVASLFHLLPVLLRYITGRDVLRIDPSMQ